MTGVTVRVPGTTANLGSGFDFLGMAVERWLQVRARCVDDRSAPAVAIERHGALSDVGAPPEQDLIYRGFAAACRVAGRDVPERLAFTADSNIPVSRGLGSSAAAVVAGAAAANTLRDLGLTPEALVALGTEIEGHPDNVAPAVYGGACLALHRPAGGLLAVPIEIHAALAFVFAIPELRVETKRARAALPAAIPHATAVQAAARGAALIHGLTTADPDSLSLGLDDLLHVPYRRSLVTGYDAVTASARAAGGCHRRAARYRYQGTARRGGGDGPASQALGRRARPVQRREAERPDQPCGRGVRGSEGAAEDDAARAGLPVGARRADERPVVRGSARTGRVPRRVRLRHRSHRDRRHLWPGLGRSGPHGTRRPQNARSSPGPRRGSGRPRVHRRHSGRSDHDARPGRVRPDRDAAGQRPRGARRLPVERRAGSSDRRSQGRA